MKIINYSISIALLFASVAQAETLEQIYHIESNSRQLGIAQLDTGEFFAVNCESSPIANADSYEFDTLGAFTNWQVGDKVSYDELSNARAGFGWNSGGTYPVLNNHDRGEYVVLSHRYGRGWDVDHFFEDRVREVNGDEVITEGQLRLFMPEAQDRWDSCAESVRWQSGDPLVIFAYRAFKNDEQMMVQPNAVINLARNDIETNLQASRSFFPFQDVLTYTVVQTKPSPRKSSDPYSMVVLSDGSVWYENQYEGMRRYKGFPKLKVGDKIALRQYDNYHWRGRSHSISQFMSFSAIRVETGEEIDLLDLGDRGRQPQGQSWQSTKSRLQFLIGGETLIEVADEATYKKVLSWGPNAKVTIALANHGDGYILVNLTAFQRTFWPLHDKTCDHWVDVRLL